jgi:hypothetical protein
VFADVEMTMSLKKVGSDYVLDFLVNTGETDGFQFNKQVAVQRDTSNVIIRQQQGVQVDLNTFGLDSICAMLESDATAQLGLILEECKCFNTKMHDVFNCKHTTKKRGTTA